MPSFMNRSCQRQTQVFDLPVRRMISLVPTLSALERMIAARQACFCEALRSLVIASSRPRARRSGRGGMRERLASPFATGSQAGAAARRCTGFSTIGRLIAADRRPSKIESHQTKS